MVKYELKYLRKKGLSHFPFCSYKINDYNNKLM